MTRATQIVEEMRLTSTRTQYHTKTLSDSSDFTLTDRWFCRRKRGTWSSHRNLADSAL
jgi:hypothetical protein